MNESLFPYYERELLFMRRLAQEFAHQYPHIAGRLLLEANRSSDSHVERLFESFAFLAGRAQQRVNDEFPEISDPLLHVLYPHYLAPVPSFAMLEFELDPLRAQAPEGFLLKKGTVLSAPSVDGVACRFRTTAPLTLWPIRVANASFQAPPFPPGVTAPPKTAALLRIQFETSGPLKLHQLQLENLRLFLHSEGTWLPLLYEFLFNNVLQVTYRPTEARAAAQPFTLPPAKCLRQVGFDPGDELVPYPPRAPLGYRLLTEYFTFPAKFMYVELGGWKRVARAKFEGTCEVNLFLDRTHKFLEQNVDRSTFRLGCAPIVNLFSHTIENLEMIAPQSSYTLVPEPAYPRAYEIYSVDEVSHRDPTTNATIIYPPFQSVDHDLAPEKPMIHWYPSRAASLDEGDRGTDVSLHFVDLGFVPRVPDRPFLTVQLTCTNRDLPDRLASLGDALAFQLETAAPLKEIRIVRPPTTPLRPGRRRGRAWRLVSHLTLNHLSLTGGDEGLEAFRDLFRLYDYSDPDAGQAQLSNVALEVADGIVGIKSRRVIGQLEEAGTALFCRGVETTIELDEEKVPGIYLLASVLERFLGLYVSANSFTELIVKTRQRPGVFKHWPPRPGQLPTL
jgi:type VI secretion system protein ImpG